MGQRPKAREGSGEGWSPAQQIGDLFRSARESQNLSQEQLASLVHARPGRVSRAMISAVERGRHLPGLEVLLTLSHALHISPNEVLERLELARAEAVDAAELSYEELDLRASKSFWNGDPRRAAAYYDAMIRRLRDSPSRDDGRGARDLATVEMRRGTALRRCGAIAAARAAIERSIALSDDLPEVQAQAYLVLVALFIQSGCLPLARDAADRAVALAARVDDRKLLGWTWVEKGVVLAACERYEEARRAFLEARRQLEGTADHAHRITVEGNIGHCLHHLGHYPQARRRYVAAIELARTQRIPASEAHWTLELGRLSLACGKLDEADGCAAAALRIAKPKELRLICFRAEWLRHLVHQKHRPGDRDRHRIAYLKRLYVRLEEHGGIEEIGEFKAMYCSASPVQGRLS